jgi:hypothetical protein
VNGTDDRGDDPAEHVADRGPAHDAQYERGGDHERSEQAAVGLGGSGGVLHGRGVAEVGNRSLQFRKD